MMPLDLTRAAPRSPDHELGGLCMLPRMIDIARAKLPGGKIGEYQIGRGMSSVVLTSFGIDARKFVEIVRGAASEDEVAERLWQLRSIAPEAVSARLRGLTVADVPADIRAEFQQLYGADLPADRRVFELIETDDAKTFARPKP
jgi:hypothetical protein